MRTNVYNMKRNRDRQRKKKHNLITCDQPYHRQANPHRGVSSMTEISKM